MKVNLEEIDQKEFKVSRRADPLLGDVVLINPGFDKGKWTDCQMHLRSLLCDPSGNVISSGFPKFCNYGEQPEKDLDVAVAISSGNAEYSDKKDGSLVIRTVVNGKVHFRTRGSNHLGSFEEPIMKLINREYPDLLKTGLVPEDKISYLFEYTSPENKIILSYSKPELTLLAAVTWQVGELEYAYWTETELGMIAKIFGVPMVKFFSLPNNLNDILNEVGPWIGSEGIVVRCTLPDGQLRFVKIKASEYIRLHSLKYHFSDEKIRLFAWSKNIRTVAVLQSELLSLGLDWEVISFVEPIFNEYIKLRLQIEESVFSFINLINEHKVSELPERKQKALKLQELSIDTPDLFQVGIQYVTGNSDYISKYIMAKSLGVSVMHLGFFQRTADDFVSLISAHGEKNG